MAITAKDVAELRAKTGVGMMECKKALTEANGDMDEAIKLLREKGMQVADKKAARIAAEGVVSILSKNGKTAMIEVNSETDFVAKNASFQEFVTGLLETILETGASDVDALMSAKFVGEDRTVDEVLKEKIFTIGEKLTIRRFIVVDGITSTYVHGGGTIGVIVVGDTETDNDDVHAILKNVALQVAAMQPDYLTREDVPASVLAEEKDVILNQMKNDPKNATKPENILEKMVTGKLGKFYSQNCLLEQEYVKDESMTIAKYVESAAKDAGVALAVKSFIMYKKGEGLQKREENFAEEIAKLTNKQ